MKKVIRSGLVASALLVLAVAPADAVITFTQLDHNTFTVSHRVKGLGGRGKAMELVYTKAASLCVAAGYTHYQVLDQESQASQQYEAANATLTLKFFLDGAADRVSCHPGSDPEYVEEARAKLQSMAYNPPELGPLDEVGSSADGKKTYSDAPCPQGCTIEQIAAMARAGLSDEKIRAACEGGAGQGEPGSEN